MRCFVFGKREKTIIRELAKGEKIAAVARNNGIHRSTIHRWLRHEEVHLYYELHKTQEDQKTLAELDRRLSNPIPWVQLSASKKIMDMVLGKLKKPEVKIIIVSDK